MNTGLDQQFQEFMSGEGNRMTYEQERDAMAKKYCGTYDINTESGADIFYTFCDGFDEATEYWEKENSATIEALQSTLKEQEDLLNEMNPKLEDKNFEIIKLKAELKLLKGKGKT